MQLTEIYHSKKLSQAYGELVVYKIDKLEFKTNANTQVNYELELVDQFDKSQVEEVPVEEIENKEDI